jgi:hypothetical protein
MAAEFGQAIVPAPLVVVIRIRTLRQFFNETLFEETLDRRIERAGAEPNRTVGTVRNILHHRVAVAIPVGERYKDLKGIPMQWEK